MQLNPNEYIKISDGACSIYSSHNLEYIQLSNDGHTHWFGGYCNPSITYQGDEPLYAKSTHKQIQITVNSYANSTAGVSDLTTQINKVKEAIQREYKEQDKLIHNKIAENLIKIDANTAKDLIEKSAREQADTTIKASIQSIKSELTTKFDNLSVGGRNLLFNTANFSGYLSFTNRARYTNMDSFGRIDTISSGHVGILVNTKSTHTIKANEQAILSFEYRTDMPNLLYTYIINDNKNYWIVPNHNVANDGQWQRAVMRFTVLRDLTNVRALMGAMSAPVGSYLEIRKVKLERGNVATDWTPAPEDLELKPSDNINVASIRAGVSSPRIAYKTIVGTINRDGRTTSVPHGLNGSKILSIYCSVGLGQWYIPVNRGDNGEDYTIVYNNNSINITPLNKIDKLKGNNFKLFITYEV